MQPRGVPAVLVAFSLLLAPACGEKSGLEIEDVTCGELKERNSWNAVATDQADLVTDGDPRPETVAEYEGHFRAACAGAADDFKPLDRVTELREQGGG